LSALARVTRSVTSPSNLSDQECDEDINRRALEHVLRRVQHSPAEVMQSSPVAVVREEVQGADEEQWIARDATRVSGRSHTLHHGLTR
jgi:hypothetical protein